jgi:hypothetical protein
MRHAQRLLWHAPELVLIVFAILIGSFAYSQPGDIDHECRPNQTCANVAIQGVCPPGVVCVDTTTPTTFDHCMPQLQQSCVYNVLQTGTITCSSGACNDKPSSGSCSYTLHKCK